MTQTPREITKLTWGSAEINVFIRMIWTPPHHSREMNKIRGPLFVGECLVWC